MLPLLEARDDPDDAGVHVAVVVLQRRDRVRGGEVHGCHDNSVCVCVCVCVLECVSECRYVSSRSRVYFVVTKNMGRTHL